MAQGSLPGVSVADQAIARIRAIFAAPGAAPGEKLWSLLELGERRGLLRRAALVDELAPRDWRELDDASRLAIVVAWRRLRDRVLYLAAKVAA